MTLAKLYGGTPRSAPGWAVITSTDPNNAWYISVTEPASGIWAEDPSVLAADTGGYLQDGLTG